MIPAERSRPLEDGLADERVTGFQVEGQGFFFGSRKVDCRVAFKAPMVMSCHVTRSADRCSVWIVLTSDRSLRLDTREMRQPSDGGLVA